MFSLRRIETVPLPSKAEAAHGINISDTGHIAICAPTCILIYQIVPKENAGKGISCRTYIIPSPKYTLKDDLGINIKEFLYELPREEYYECILTADITPDIDNALPYVPKFIKCLWSSPHCDTNHDCILATLSSNGIVEIYAKVYNHSYNSDFTKICNVSQRYVAILKETWRGVENQSCTEKLAELLYRTNEIKVKCFTWSSRTSEGHFVLVLAHVSGKITFWRISSQTTSAEMLVDHLCVYQTDLSCISCLTWKEVNNGALLLFGTKDGQVHTLNISITSETLHAEKKVCLCTEKDNQKVHSIHAVNTKYGNFILLVKLTTIVIISLDKSFQNYEFACNNIEIIDIVTVENDILILTKTGVMKEMILTTTSSGIDIKWRHYYIDINAYIKSPITMAASKNKVLFFFLTKSCKAKQTKVHTWNVELHIFSNNENKCLKLLLNSPSKQLTYMWDYLELYRCSALQTKNLLLDTIQFKKHYDKYDFYTLKVFLYVSRICESLLDQLKNVPTFKSSDDIFSIFHLKMMVLRMQYILELHRKNCTLSLFHKQNLVILSNYIQQVVAEDIAQILELSDLMMDLIVDVMQRVKKITLNGNSIDDCMTCGEKLYDITCMPPHFDSRCAISLMQIKGIVNYKCVLCKSVAHEEIANEVRVVVCPFCDVPMVKRPEKVEICQQKEPAAR